MPLWIAVAGVDGATDPDPLPHAALDHLAKDPPLEIAGANSVAVGDQHLRLAEQQNPVVASAKWKRREDPRLRLGGEVHQRVAADQQVDPRDRRVLDQVVATEDDRAAQILAKDVAAVVRSKYRSSARSARPRSRAADRRHAAPGPAPPRPRRWRRSSPARGTPRRRAPGEHHRDRVRLLACRAAGAPDPDRRVGRRRRAAPGRCARAGDSQASGSRKKPVTLISSVLNSSTNSRGVGLEDSPGSPRSSRRRRRPCACGPAARAWSACTR